MNRPDVYDELSTTRDMQQKSLYIKRLYFCLYSIKLYSITNINTQDEKVMNKVIWIITVGNYKSDQL